MSSAPDTTTSSYLPTAGEVLEPVACLLRHVSRTSRAVVAAYDPALAPFGLTGHQFNLMTTLQNMKSLSVGALATHLGMDPSGIPRAIRPLVNNNLLKVETGADKRQRVLSLTEEGEAKVTAATGAWVKVQEELVNNIGADHWTNLMGELNNLRRAAARCSTRDPVASKITAIA